MKDNWISEKVSYRKTAISITLLVIWAYYIYWYFVKSGPEIHYVGSHIRNWVKKSDPELSMHIIAIAVVMIVFYAQSVWCMLETIHFNLSFGHFIPLLAQCALANYTTAHSSHADNSSRLGDSQDYWLNNKRSLS